MLGLLCFFFCLLLFGLARTLGGLHDNLLAVGTTLGAQYGICRFALGDLLLGEELHTASLLGPQLDILDHGTAANDDLGAGLLMEVDGITAIFRIRGVLDLLPNKKNEKIDG